MKSEHEKQNDKQKGKSGSRSELKCLLKKSLKKCKQKTASIWIVDLNQKSQIRATSLTKFKHEINYLNEWNKRQKFKSFKIDI